MTTDDQTNERQSPTPQQLAEWMTTFCQRNYANTPQHVFWDIQRYLLASVPLQVARDLAIALKLAKYEYRVIRQMSLEGATIVQGARDALKPYLPEDERAKIDD